MIYKYELHLHTSQGSACGKTPGREYVRAYMDLGYSGIFVTDHFFQGNCAVDSSRPWHARVEAYMEGYRDAKREGDKLGFPVFFGVEQNFDKDEYLLYGIDACFLHAHEDMESWSRARLFSEVRAYGGCVAQAHPFRERAYITRITLAPHMVDAVETVNACNEPMCDALAARYARNLDLPAICGSDLHNIANMNPDKLCAAGFERPLNSERDLARAILARERITIIAPGSRGEWIEGAKSNLPVTVLNKRGEPAGQDVAGYLGDAPVS